MGGSLDDFDEVVRNDLPIAVDSSLGSGLALVPPRSLYFLCLGCLLFSFDLLLHVYDISQASRWFLFAVAAMFIWYPVWIMAVTAVEHKVLQCSVCKAVHKICSFAPFGALASFRDRPARARSTMAFALLHVCWWRFSASGVLSTSSLAPTIS